MTGKLCGLHVTCTHLKYLLTSYTACNIHTGYSKDNIQTYLHKATYIYNTLTIATIHIIYIHYIQHVQFIFNNETNSDQPLANGESSN